jgi:DNA repair protein RecN (Recombination protein N)
MLNGYTWGVSMLTELTITDFAIIESLTLRFDAGFNVLTGETGAGKSIIIDAVTMLLGGRADTSFIRTGSKRAKIEGLFRLSPLLRQVLDPLLEAEGLEGDNEDTLVLSREIRATGRSFARVNGSTVSLNLLETITRPLVDIHGQNEHLSLTRVKQHQRFLDRYGGLVGQRETLAGEVKRMRQTQLELAALQRDAQSLARRVDQLSFQVEEIEAANLRVGEEEELNIERIRLANAEQLSQITGEVNQLLVEADDPEQLSVTDLLGQVARAVQSLTRLDPTWAEQSQLVENVTYQLEDLAGFIRDYSDSIDFNPGRLREIEERLSLIFNLKRKYGDSIAEILAFGERAGAELENISHSEERIEELQLSEEGLRRKIGGMALALSQARRAAAEQLSAGVVTQLTDLGMPDTRFHVDIQWVSDAEGVYVPVEKGEPQLLACDERGIDQIEFLISANLGEAPKPLVKVASGGETSRILLALKTVLANADETPTLIFDEIDQGIGGRIGGVVGQKLWGLARDGVHQVLCVTHLPQIAGYAARHYHVTKQVANGRTQTGVRQLSGEQQVEELAQMLGTLSESTRQSAREILDQAAGVTLGV